mmetsp:Transcript_16472/g.29116  ORF Transcript_16472/g.29116 Transcript_16472/m.29116 type:complete len:211 (+) Transcript_16472:102-734(+)
MFQAVTRGDHEFLSVLFRAGEIRKEDLEKCSDVGTSPAYLAVLNGRLKVLEVLHELGVELSRFCDPMQHGSPLFYAIMHDKFKVVETLCKLGVDLEAPCDKFGKTARYWAMRLKKYDLADLLDKLIEKSRAERAEKESKSATRLQASFRGYRTRKERGLVKGGAADENIYDQGYNADYGYNQQVGYGDPGYGQQQAGYEQQEYDQGGGHS